MTDWVMILAVLGGPVLAVQVQKYLDVLRERRHRKGRVFQMLMGTRAARLSAEHVQALNMIDIEFYGRTYFGMRRQSKAGESVIAAWRIYQEHLNIKYPDDQLQEWFQKGDDLFTELLFRMSRALGYDFDTVQLKRGCYSPIAHGEMENDQFMIRKSLTKILSGEESFPMKIVSFPITEEDAQRQQAVQRGLLDCFEGKQPLRVVLESKGYGHQGREVL